MVAQNPAKLPWYQKPLMVFETR